MSDRRPDICPHCKGFSNHAPDFDCRPPLSVRNLDPGDQKYADRLIREFESYALRSHAGSIVLTPSEARQAMEALRMTRSSLATCMSPLAEWEDAHKFPEMVEAGAALKLADATLALLRSHLPTEGT